MGLELFSPKNINHSECAAPSKGDSAMTEAKKSGGNRGGGPKFPDNLPSKNHGKESGKGRSNAPSKKSK